MVCTTILPFPCSGNNQPLVLEPSLSPTSQLSYLVFPLAKIVILLSLCLIKSHSLIAKWIRFILGSNLAKDYSSIPTEMLYTIPGPSLLSWTKKSLISNKEKSFRGFSDTTFRQQKKKKEKKIHAICDNLQKIFRLSVYYLPSNS